MIWDLLFLKSLTECQNQKHVSKGKMKNLYFPHLDLQDLSYIIYVHTTAGWYWNFINQCISHLIFQRFLLLSFASIFWDIAVWKNILEIDFIVQVYIVQVSRVGKKTKKTGFLGLNQVFLVLIIIVRKKFWNVMENLNNCG